MFTKLCIQGYSNWTIFEIFYRYLEFVKTDNGFVTSDPKNPCILTFIEIEKFSKFLAAILGPPSWIYANW